MKILLDDLKKEIELKLNIDLPILLIRNNIKTNENFPYLKELKYIDIDYDIHQKKISEFIKENPYNLKILYFNQEKNLKFVSIENAAYYLIHFKLISKDNFLNEEEFCGIIKYYFNFETDNLSINIYSKCDYVRSTIYKMNQEYFQHIFNILVLKCFHTNFYSSKEYILGYVDYLFFFSLNIFCSLHHFDLKHLINNYQIKDIRLNKFFKNLTSSIEHERNEAKNEIRKFNLFKKYILPEILNWFQQWYLKKESYSFEEINLKLKQFNSKFESTIIEN